MSFVALTCPQCGGPLPRQAAWRMVACPHCRAVVTRSAATVQRAEFRAALDRARGSATTAAAARTLDAGPARYALRHLLGIGRHADVWFAERLGAVRGHATIKLARDAAGGPALRAEARTLDVLQALHAPGAAYFGQRLPQPLFAGTALEAGGDRREVLVLRHPAGAWGSLADAMRGWPGGVDPRHVVWMWRRVLETLAWLHRTGWTHGDLAPEHLLVEPERHGIRIIGWGHASHAQGAALATARERDLRQLAWSMRALLTSPGEGEPAIAAHVPKPLAALLRAATEQAGAPFVHDAEAAERVLVEAADASFGSPRFVVFDPLGGRDAAG